MKVVIKESPLAIILGKLNYRKVRHLGYFFEIPTFYQNDSYEEYCRRGKLMNEHFIYEVNCDETEHFILVDSVQNKVHVL
jgi:hypothetical protein